ncbi:hypothetical protein MMC26_006250 [Xylographa opegraphella]|nr:hypothetical protein [Xylographa opegraphella]
MLLLLPPLIDDARALLTELETLWLEDALLEEADVMNGTVLDEIELLEPVARVYTAIIPVPPHASDGSPLQATLGSFDVLGESSNEANGAAVCTTVGPALVELVEELVLVLRAFDTEVSDEEAVISEPVPDTELPGAGKVLDTELSVENELVGMPNEVLLGSAENVYTAISLGPPHASDTSPVHATFWLLSATPLFTKMYGDALATIVGVASGMIEELLDVARGEVPELPAMLEVADT